jgi:hypothetical protein
MNEIWKSLKNVVDSGDNYEISNLGNIRNVIRNKIIKGRNTPKGYLKVILSFNGIRKSYSIHRLVALAFIPNLENKPQVNHIDGDKKNNYIDNLEWATNGENQKHAFSNGLQSNRKGENNSSSKLKDSIVLDIIELYKTGYSQRELAKIYSVSKTAISNIVTGKSWKHVD